MSKLLALMLACLALGLVAVGCGDDSDDGGDGGGGGAAATTEQAPPETSAGGDAAAKGDGAAKSGGAQAGGGAEAVDIVDIDYDPREVTVPAGTTVTWTNTGDLPHTVTKEGGPGPDFDSGTLDPGDTFEQTFETAGTIDYVCTIHAGQRGSVTVQ